MATSLFDLSGKTALVTGARKGIGLAMARVLAENGADLIVASSQQAPDDELTRWAIEQGVKIEAHAVDLRSRIETKGFIEKLHNRKIDILVNNAGLANRGEFLDHTDDQWDETLEIDLTAPFLLSREIARGMVERGYGKIIFTASMWTFLGGKNVISYTAAKTALGGLVRGMSNELVGKGVRVNGIAPGFIETDINIKVRQDKERFQFISSRIPSGSWGKPEDLAGTTLFLAAPASDYVSGVIIPVDGGYLAN